MSEREELGKLCREVILRCELNHLSADESADEFAGVISAREEELVAAARARALEEAADECDGAQIEAYREGFGFSKEQLRQWNEWICGVGDKIRALPSDFTALAKLVAKREALEQLIIDMRAIGKMLGEHQLASVCEDYARRAAAASAHWKCKASAANTGENDPQDCDWPTCGCDPSDPALAKLFAEERLAELNLIPQSDYWNTGLEGYIMRRKDTLMDIVAARVAELKGEQKHEL